MIGNDIVDLKQAAKDSNWKRPRFLDKIFTPREQQLIWSAKNQDQMVWLLWSMKEAAYKVNVQQFGKRFFNPKRLECTLLSNFKGEVIIEDNRYFIESTITDDFIYSIALLDRGKSYTSEWFRDENFDYKTQSTSLKDTFLKSISDAGGLDIEMLKIEKSQSGVPLLINGFVELPIRFSLTHCGQFCGYIYC
ncbi:4'-phosphopantetheinyl transferase superfamily protein [Olleya sp. HaHaR_3_96]|uniref:4'-phosphopantetheinyl transferase family protein n=1 Tax=Olleya sp. HaHaR_3_96 TaxID=2745560 RepID=UPI001C4F935A|nr:4'-phosphopantetheinyl transferase superfamily protein [Olleya sp. HaHaR_3_96]QXP60541.1 4'-phosphopantetheinyl transferase superfamily protein [Olleya sp. HaHaR_3_96]